MGEDLIVRDVTVIDGSGAAVANVEVTITDGTFVAIRPTTDATTVLGLRRSRRILASRLMGGAHASARSR